MLDAHVELKRLRAEEALLAAGLEEGGAPHAAVAEVAAGRNSGKRGAVFCIQACSRRGERVAIPSAASLTTVVICDALRTSSRFISSRSSMSQTDSNFVAEVQGKPNWSFAAGTSQAP